MQRTQAFDLYQLIGALAATDWIEEIHIFGSRRYLTNASFGSDIDLLFVPNREIPIGALRQAVQEHLVYGNYVDAFLFAGNYATSCANETRIPLTTDMLSKAIDAVLLWTRTSGWQTGDSYRAIDILPDSAPAPSLLPLGASPVVLFSALSSEFKSLTERLPKGTLKNSPHMPLHYLTHVISKSGRKRLVVAVQTGVASVNAGIAATRIFDYFSYPDLAVLVGIAAGLGMLGNRIGQKSYWRGLSERVHSAQQ